MKMEIGISNKSRTTIKEHMIEAFVLFFVKERKITGKEISIAMVGDQVMRRLNRDYRGLDKVTDILSFDGDEDSLGEIIIDLSQVRRQKALYSEELDLEILFMIAHGLLHLIGYDDEIEEERLEMIAIGKDLLDKFLKEYKSLC